MKVPANNAAQLQAASLENVKSETQAPASGKAASQGLEGKGAAQSQPAVNAKAGDVKSVFAKELFQNTAASMGFPKDALSVTLLAFARFFSLSPALLGNLRREFLNSNKNSGGLPNQGSEAPQGREKAAFEASALAAAAALDKGTALNQDAHLHYARFLLPPGDSANSSDSAGEKAGNNTHSQAGGRGQKDGDEEDLPDAEKIKAIAEEESKKDSLLDFLNTLPGKNGQHWTVFPFKITVKGIELAVFLRILKRGFMPPGEDCIVIADISGPKRQWRCFLREEGGKIQADLRVYPGVSARSLGRLRKEAERFFQGGSSSAPGFGGFGEIHVGNREESASWMEDLCAESLPSINKEV